MRWHTRENFVEFARRTSQNSHEKPVPQFLGRAKASRCFRASARAPWRNPWRGVADFPRSDGGLRTARARRAQVGAARLLRSPERSPCTRSAPKVAQADPE